MTLTDEQLLDLESKRSFLFFWEEANTDKASPGYGLIVDRAPGDSDMCSVASVGFGLTAIMIGVGRGWISRAEGYERALGTLNTLLEHAEQVNGFFYHFLNMKTARRHDNCEVSVIDTAIAVCGAIAAGEYFGCDVREYAQRLYERVDWAWYRNPEYNQFYMGYAPERGFFARWDLYAEQFMMYFLAAASPTHPVDPSMFYDFGRQYGTFGDNPPFIYTWLGSLFTFQFSHAWFDLRGKVDRDNVDWWQNSVIATKANRDYCIAHASEFRTFGPDAWGLTACDGPNGYSGRYGTAPSGLNSSNDQHQPDGTVPPAGAAGSIVFMPEEVLSALRNYYENYPQLWGRYGFKDSYNLDVSPPYYAEDVIGIDKGITLLMIENYRSGLVWDYFMRNAHVQRGMALCEIREKETELN
ncbi:hypothetical protein A8990_12970 [Paenibacillus taihuensis]|uniref:Glycoamylase-like domain-containing protein n=1 Tax=Paenibacillus taihuensis TaxID=1156355 RepID=A0A3D9QWX8_9BACL|nr:glucoamylase family protein [Paenibacillus taihuensis]REE70585.1 hypothetical protein A8990_12970 [Paenibacillus taihuensis]